MLALFTLQLTCAHHSEQLNTQIESIRKACGERAQARQQLEVAILGLRKAMQDIRSASETASRHAAELSELQRATQQLVHTVGDAETKQAAIEAELATVSAQKSTLQREADGMRCDLS